jgi:hemerythrin-like domain-containing protein
MIGAINRGELQMRIRLARILDELREDHRNLTRLLDLLESECRDVPEEGQPDMELLHDIMHYMTVYPDAIHHPREDLVYTAMREHCADLAEGLEGVPDDHREIAELGATLRKDIEAIISGAAVTRQHLLEDLVNYVGHLRRHMEWEESDLFPRADSLARDNETATLDVSQHMGDDPVFGATTARSFSNLLANLQRAP